MRKYYANVMLLGLALLVGGCATWRSLSGALPVPPRVDSPRLEIAKTDRPLQVPTGFPWISTTDPEDAMPSLALTQKAWESLELYMEALRRAYCEGRATIEIANGGQPTPIPLCQPPQPE